MRMNLTIGEITRACGGRLICGMEETGEDVCVSSFVIDSRKVEEGGVFLATVGERVDGHKFISAVFEKGAALAVIQKTREQVAAETGEDTSGWGCCLLVEDTLKALRDVAEYYRQKAGIPVVGITGSVGKTTTKEFIAGVLAEKYAVWKTEGNYNNGIGVPLTLLGIRPCHQVAVVEMGISDFGEMHVLSKMARPNVCVMTNIGQSHLETLGSREGILRAKSEIFDFMAPDGEICLNGEDDMLCAITEIKGHRPHFFGLGGKGDPVREKAIAENTSRHPEGMAERDGSPFQEVSARDVVSRGLWGSDATIYRYKDGELETFPIQIPLPGEHMVLNAAAAACVAGLFGLTPEQIAEGLGRLSAVSGRSNLLRLPGFTVIDDCYNANPASMRAAIGMLAQADTMRVAILGDMFELGEDSARLHWEVGACGAEAGIEMLLMVGEEARHMYEGAVQRRKEGQKLFYFETLGQLLEELERDREKYVPGGCTVLVKASHGMEFVKILDLLKSHQ